jgi:beta-lactamase class A
MKIVSTALAYVIPSVLLGAAISYVALTKQSSLPTDKERANSESKTEVVDKTHYELSSQKPQKGLEMISPLLFANPANESKDYLTLKNEISALVENDKSHGLLSAASVFLVNFAEGEWMYLNPDQSYHPGSLIKVPMLMTFLSMAETDPAVMDKKITFNKVDNLPHQTFNSSTIQPGNTYTVRELLHFMIANSDNNATHLLNQNADLNLFVKVFTDLNLPRPDVRDRNFEISAKSYSEFLMVLYNSTYLSKKSSEYALELLSEVGFKDGILRGLPPAVKVAHKFGEWGDVQRNIHELHEAGIVYLNDKPYLLTIMTRGENTKILGEEIGKISKLVYDFISEKQVNNAYRIEFSMAKK